jgi:hypothetical protein
LERLWKEGFIEKFRNKDSRKIGFTKDNWEKQTGRKRKHKLKTSTSKDTKSSITKNTHEHKIPTTRSINNATQKLNPKYYIQKGLEVIEAMHSTQYH